MTEQALQAQVDILQVGQDDVRERIARLWALIVDTYGAGVGGAPALHELVGTSHDESGLSIGQLVRATAATTFDWSGPFWQDSIIDKDLATPPGAPAAGDRYIVAATATGDWVGQEDNLTEWDGSAWLFVTPTEGLSAWVDDENIIYQFDGSAWVRIDTLFAGGNITAPGSDTQLVFNDGGVFGADAGLTWNKATKNLVLASTNGIDINPGSDTDVALISVGVTNSPKFEWDESGNLFSFNKSVRISVGNLTVIGSISTTGTVDGVDIQSHASRHERAGDDEIDGDHLGIDFTPSNYTPDISPAEAAHVDDLAAHLAGIDNAIPAGGGPAGSDTYMQFNDGGSAFGGESDLTWNKTTNVLALSTASAIGAVTRTMAGIQLSARSHELESGIGPAVKFMSEDPQLTTENPKLGAVIVGQATETYSADTKGGMGIGFYVTDYDPGATNVPVQAMNLWGNGRLSVSNGGLTWEAILDLTQDNTDEAIPVARFKQDDISEPFLEFVGSAAAATLTQSIVDEVDVVTATRQGFLKIEIQDDGNRIADQSYFIPIFTLA